MEAITIGQIAGIITVIVGVIEGIKYLVKDTRKILTDEISRSIQPLTKRVDDLSNQINTLDIGQCKNFLVRFLADIEQGVELDKSEIERAYEIYDHYTNTLKQNSYIHQRWCQLMNSKNKGE